ncbi:MAG: DUF4422 domain-containing protein [Alphaproteobacteria bacterium]|nr:DUF4422 domain-containing protein [Alphaproteobacteria bacterium]
MKILKKLCSYHILTVIVAILAGYIIYQLQTKKLKPQHPTFAIYDVYHKEYTVYQNEVVIPIQAGRVLKRDFGLVLEDQMIGDDTGDNISEKNQRYAELTVMYWIWKNAPKTDYVGIMHYRRLFSNIYYPQNCPEENAVLCSFGLTQFYLEQLMAKYDIILPLRSEIKNVYRHYKHFHHIEDLDLAVEYIKNKYPKMAVAVDNTLSCSSFNNANMFIMRREVFDEYAAWLFDILFHLEDKLSHDTEGYNVRTPGFLAERLFNIWLTYHRNQYRIKELMLNQKNV